MHSVFPQRKNIFIIAFVFFLVILTSLFSYRQPTSTYADTDFSMQTGYYLGTGTTRTITGLGFRPEIVIVKSETAAAQVVWKSSAMPASVTSYLGVATADNTESQITFTDDGFIVSGSPEVNTASVRYVYIAFVGSDCTSGGNMCVGTYFGNGSTTQDIVTGFDPDLVWTKRTTAVLGNYRTSSMADNYAGYFSATLHNTAGIFFRTLNSNGFTVGASNNTAAGLFYYVAFKESPGKLKVGNFAGNGVDNRNITGVGFEPDFVMVKQDSAVSAVFNTTEMYGDYSASTIALASAVNHIQELQSDGFQVGNSTSVNANGITSNYFAFGGSPDPQPSGSFLMERGSYTGNGTSQTISTSFAPNLVLIKGNTAQYAVWGTSLTGDLTEYLSAPSNSFAGGITSMSESSFSVGPHATVNTQDIKYEYTVFGNATTPQNKAGASDFYMGSYTGNGIESRSIDHLNFAPDMLVIKRSTGASPVSGLLKFSSPLMADNTTASFFATADVTNGSLIKALDDGSFMVSSTTAVNLSGALINWFAFKEGSGFDIGSYTGDGVDNRDISSLPFTPDLAFIKRDGAFNPVFRSSSLSLADGFSQHFMNLIDDTGDIKSFITNGFKLGTSAEVNANAASYRYAAWRKTTSASAPNTPVNQTPAGGSVDRDLKPTLSAPYSDSDSDTMTASQWQVDDDSDFGSPVWSANLNTDDTSVAVNSTAGVFANELSGKDELNHNTVYYWRVRYSDGVYSEWSAGTSFTTNAIETPQNISPANTASVTSLTPVLTASSFSDPQTGHTALNAQWQVASDKNFSSISYDSEAVSYSTTHAVPTAILSDRNTYYWRVRYQDSTNQWSAYSTSTRFLVAESAVSVVPTFGNVSVDQGDVVKIDAQVRLANGGAIDDATVRIDIFNPSGTKIVSSQTMSYLSGSDGVYRYSYTIPATSGSYLYTVNATSGGKTGYGASNFEVGITDAGILDIQSRVSSLQSNIDILLGAFISANSSIVDASASSNSFITSLTNSTDDFYKNSVLTFTSGNLNNQTRRISAYDGDTKRITLSPSLTSAPSNGSTFTIVKQNVYVEEQVGNLQSDVTSIKNDVAYIKSRVDDIYSLLQSVDTKINTAQTTLNQIRSTQQKFYRAQITDVTELVIEDSYNVRLNLYDYEGNAVSSGSTTIKIYDSTDALVASGTMSADVSLNYSYAYPLPSDSQGGLWRAEVTTDVGDLPSQTLVDYFYVKGSPAQVLVNSMSDTSIPEVVAAVTIENEGNGDYEYQYEWCVVKAQENQCGGSDDVYYASAAKLIDAGQVFNTNLSATVPEEGEYWFKVLVHYGKETSGASRSFAATKVATTNSNQSSQGSSSGGFAQRITVDSLHSEIVDLKEQILETSSKLKETLDIIGIKKPDGKSLVDITNEQVSNFRDIQNKLNELSTVSSSIRQVVEQGNVNPVVDSFMENGGASIGLSFLVTNPASAEQVVKFKTFLPEEVKPEDILDADNVAVEFDSNTNTYFAAADIKLGPKESIIKEIRIKNVWTLAVDELENYKKQAEDYAAILQKTQYDGQGSLIKNNILGYTDVILLKQQEALSSPQKMIITYRENKIWLESIKSDLEKLKDLVVQSGADKGLFGRLGGIELFSTWGIVLTIVLAFGFLALNMSRMWRKQNLLMERILNNQNQPASDVRRGDPTVNSNVSYRTMSSPRDGTRQVRNVRESLNDSSFSKLINILLWIAIIVVTAGVILWIVQNLPRFLSVSGESVSAVPALSQVSAVSGSEGVPVIQAASSSDFGNQVGINLEADSAIEQQLNPSLEIQSTSSAESIVTPQTTKEPVVEVVTKKQVKILKTPTGWLNVRNDYSSKGKVIGKVNTGDTYEFLENRNDWYRIVMKNGKKGWVASTYVEEVK